MNIVIGEQSAPKDKSNYFGVFEEVEQFYAHDLPSVPGYFAVLNILYYFDGNETINKILDNDFLGKFEALQAVPNEGFCEIYGDLYYRSEDSRIAYLKGVRYGDVFYHSLTLESWQKICECINLLKHANDNTIDDTIEDADHTFTSLFLNEKFKELVQYCKDAVTEAGNKKITASYADMCPTTSKMIENNMYVVPFYKDDKEIDHYERYIKINGTKYDLGEWGHSSENYYTKEKADELYKKADAVSAEGSLGLTSNIIYKVMSGQTRVNKKIVSTTLNKNTEPVIIDIDDDNFIGKVKTRIINGFQEVMFDVTSKGGSFTYSNTDEMHGAKITLPADTLMIPSLKEASNMENDAFLKGYMKVEGYTKEMTDVLKENRPFKYGVCYINGNDIYIIADLNTADITYKGYILYPVWGNEVIR